MTCEDSSQTLGHLLYQHYNLNLIQDQQREPHLPFQAHHQHLPTHACVFQLHEPFLALHVFQNHAQE